MPKLKLEMSLERLAETGIPCGAGFKTKILLELIFSNGTRNLLINNVIYFLLRVAYFYKTTMKVNNDVLHCHYVDLNLNSF